MGTCRPKAPNFFHMLSITIAFIVGGESRHQEGRWRPSWISKTAVMCNLKVPRSRLVSLIESQCWCPNDPGRGVTSTGTLKAAILDFQDGLHLKSKCQYIGLLAIYNVDPGVKMPALTYLLPLFYAKAATASMIKHGMDL